MTLPLAEGLPTWSAILIALGSSAVGGVAGSVLTTWRQIRHQKEEQMRTLMLAAADEFATGVLQAHQALRRALVHDPMTLTPFVKHFEEHEPEAWRTVDEAHARLARVMLLFGYGTPAATAAIDATTDQRNALWNVQRAGDEEREQIRRDSLKLVRAALNSLSRFTEAARKAAQNPLVQEAKAVAKSAQAQPDA